MKKCTQCGKAIPDNFPSCPSCGAPVVNGPSEVVKENIVYGEKPTVNFYKHVKEFGGIHCFFLYFFKLLYVLGVIAMIGALVMIPFIPTSATATFDMFSMDFGYEGLTSIFKIVMEHFNTFKNDTSDFAPLVEIIGLIPSVILLIPAVIWAVIKLIRCIILLCISPLKKKTVVVESLAKIQHREYDYGMLNVDWLYFYALIVVVITVVLVMLKVILFELSPDAFTSVDGYTKVLDIFYRDSTDTVFTIDSYKNFGTVTVVAGVVIAGLLDIVFVIVRGIVKRKVKKHFGLNKK